MLLSETFVIGNGSGLYPVGSTIKDKVFDNSRVVVMDYNGTTIYPNQEFTYGGGECTFTFTTNEADTIIVTFYKY